MYVTYIKVGPHYLYRLSRNPGLPAVEDSRKYQIYLVLEAGHGMVVENDLVVPSNIHFGSETGIPIEIGVLVVSDFIIGTVYGGFFDSNHFSEHIIP